MSQDQQSSDTQGAIKADELQLTEQEREQASAAQQLKQSEKSASDLSIKVKVHSPYKVFFQGLASSISAVNDTGPFDVLPKHDNFICLLRPCDLIIRLTQEGDRKIQISGGVMHVKADMATVFLDI